MVECGRKYPTACSLFWDVRHAIVPSTTEHSCSKMTCVVVRPSIFTVVYCWSSPCPLYTLVRCRWLVNVAVLGGRTFHGLMYPNEATMMDEEWCSWTPKVSPMQRRSQPILSKRLRRRVGTAQIRCQNGPSASGSRDTAFVFLPRERFIGPTPNLVWRIRTLTTVRWKNNSFIPPRLREPDFAFDACWPE